MMNNLVKNIIKCLLLFLLLGIQVTNASTNTQAEDKEINVRELILEHLADSYEWHITNIGEKHISIPLPVIVKGKESGWHVFLSSHFHHGTESYEGFHIAKEGDLQGKIVEINTSGEEVRPLDISITKNVCSLLFSCILLVILILSVANWYKKQQSERAHRAPKGFIGFMEMFIMNVNDELIKPCVGKDYKRYAPYLLTAFFFIFINNLLGLIPIFPGGANLTGNIAVTLVLALFTFFTVNLFGSKEYWKEIFWPDVPVWLKIPPIMPALELVGVFTKPFALMIRLFANILAGHSIVLGLTCLIFVTVNLGPALNTGMTIVSVLLTVFISFVEVLVAYIQAYVFTMLSAVFIGLSRVEPHHAHSKEEKNNH